VKYLIAALLLPLAGFAYAQYSAAPAPVATESYIACGCGCCGGTAPVGADSCVTPEELLRIKEADAEAAKSPSCAMAGCSMGKRYQTCE